jgi:hypothetical protein
MGDWNWLHSAAVVLQSWFTRPRQQRPGQLWFWPHGIAWSTLPPEDELEALVEVALVVVAPLAATPVVAVLAAEVDAEPEVAPPLPDAEVTAPLLLVETLVPPTPFANPPPDVSPGLVEPPKPSAPGVPKSEESNEHPARRKAATRAIDWDVVSMV